MNLLPAGKDKSNKNNDNKYFIHGTPNGLESVFLLFMLITTSSVLIEPWYELFKVMRKTACFKSHYSALKTHYFHINTHALPGTTNDERYEKKSWSVPLFLW
jgi:hypothetical protein